MMEIRRAKGEGHWCRNNAGGFTLRKSVGYKADGHRKVLTVSASSKPEALKKMKKKEKQWEEEKRKFTFQKSMTFAEFMSWHLIKAKAYLKPRSYDRLEGTISNQIAKYPIGHQQISSMRAEDFERHFQDLVSQGLAASSVKKVFDAINDAYRYAIMNEKVPSNPMTITVKEIETLVEERDKKIFLTMHPDKKLDDFYKEKAGLGDVDYLSDMEITAIKNICMEINPKTGKTLYSMGLTALFLLYTGARAGEVLSLQWQDYDPASKVISIYKNHGIARNRDGGDNKTIRILGYTKNKKVRRIKLSDDAIQIIKQKALESDFCSPEDLIFPTRTGRHNTATNMEHCFARIERKAGLPRATGSLHVLRKTFATKMFRQGARIEEIAAYIGDEPETVRKYYIGMKDKEGTVVQMKDNAALSLEC